MLFGSADFGDQVMRYGGANKHTGKHKRTKQIYIHQMKEKEP